MSDADGLRYYQRDCYESIHGQWGIGIQRTLAVLPTGAGKTQLFGAIAKHFPGRVLVIAHRKELIDQAVNRLRQMTGEPVGKEQAGWRNWGERIVVASVQSAIQPERLARLVECKFDLVIADEAHHAVSRSWTKVISSFPHARVLLVTATPERADKKAMARSCDSVAYEMTMLDCIRQGWLVPFRGKSVKVKTLDISGVKVVANELHKGQLDEAIVGSVNGIVDAILEHAKDRRGPIFFPGKKSAEYAAERLNHLEPGCAVCITESTEEEDRAELFRRIMSGEARYLCNVQVATEGFDWPAADLVALARPTMSKPTHIQMLGRGTRPNVDLSDIAGRDQSDERVARIAASQKPHCIAEGQRVLTDHGLIEIQNVTTDMRVWDGCGFVHHGGAILRGEREVVEYAGLIATSDHEVWTKEGWKAFGECAAKQIPIAVTGDDGSPIREASGCFRRDHSCQRQSAPDDCVHAVQCELDEGLPLTDIRSSGVPVMREPTSGTALVGQQVQQREGKVRESAESIVQSIRRQGNSILLREPNGDGCVGPKESWTGRSEPGAGQNRQRRELRAGQPAMVFEVTKSVTHQEEASCSECARVQDEASRCPLRGLNAQALSIEYDVRRSGAQMVPHRVHEAKRRVWDILEAGPLHRFTVEGLLVHNCLVLDFVGNCGKHKNLVTVVDIFAGSYTDLVVKKAKEKMEEEPGTDPLEALEAARDALKVLAQAQTKTESEVKPFEFFGPSAIGVKPDPSYDMKFGYKPATPAQRDWLVKSGVDIPARFSMKEASRTIETLKKRRELGLATPKQLKTLGKFGWGDARLRFEAATKMLNHCAERRWRNVELRDLQNIADSYRHQSVAPSAAQSAR